MNPSVDSFYIAGGTLRSDAASYVERQADKDLYDGLLNGEFCYVLTSRQMGKSSLMVRTAKRLRECGISVVVLDLTAIGQNLTPEQWYDGLMVRLGHQLRLEDELEEHWRTNQKIGPIQRLFAAIRDLALVKSPAPIVIFVDESDTVRSLPFSTDEFFAAIRECYNRRTEDGEFSRLSFCLLGVATPSDLIRDTRLTPFNIGRRIDLNDFTPAEAAPLAKGLGLPAREANEVLDRILFWTSGHPYLTQRLCRAVVQPLSGAGGPSAVRSAKQVDALCHELFLSKHARERDDNLLFVRERLLRSEVDIGGLLTLYEDIIKAGKRVPNDEANPLVNVLRLAGVVRAAAGALTLRNRIYARVFDRDWVRQNLPGAELRRQRAAYRRGLGQAAAGGVLVLGLLFAAFGGSWAFTRAGGKVQTLFHLTEMMTILSLVFGGLLISYGPLRPVQMLLDGIRLGNAGAEDRLELNIIICQNASLLSIAAGATATLMGLIITLGDVGSDAPQLLGEKVAASFTGIFLGILLAALVFQPLKYRFLSDKAGENEAQKFGTSKVFLWLALVAIPFLLAMFLFLLVLVFR